MTSPGHRKDNLELQYKYIEIFLLLAWDVLISNFFLSYFSSESDIFWRDFFHGYVGIA